MIVSVGNFCLSVLITTTISQLHTLDSSFEPFHLFSLKEPDFQCFRERIGVAKVLEDFEQISAELKSMLLASEMQP